MKKHLLVYFLVTLIFSAAYSQETFDKGSAKGNVRDSATRKPLEFVTVVLMDSTGTKSLKTTVSKADGSFIIQGLAIKKYKIILTYIGYKNQTIDIPVLTESNRTVDLGRIFISTTTKALKEVEVTAIKPIIKNDVDKITYDVEADPESKTMNALDLLRKVPLITVDGDENVLLKGGSGYKVLVNGKTSSMFVRDPKEVFKSMPASTIKSIEVITNPPAKYDAEGIGGIINIITNKKNMGGYNGSVNIGASSPKGYNFGGYVTAKFKKFGFSGNYSNGLYSSPQNQSNFYRTDYSLGNSSLNQVGLSKFEGHFQNIGAELSYEIDTLNLLTANYNMYRSKGDNDLSQLVEYRNGENTLLQSYNRKNDSNFEWFGSDIGLDYQKTFKRNKDQILTLSYKLNRGGNGNNSDFVIEPVLNFDNSISTTNNDGISNEHTAQVDYVHPIKNITIETGLKSIFRINKSDYYYKNYNEETNSYEIDESQSNVFEYYQDIYAGYGSVNFKKGKWGFKVGIRAEETIINADFKSSDTTAHQDYFNFIPSVTVSHNLTTTSTLRLAFNQRIQRPGLWHLNPYVNRIDPKNLYYGNPGLKPSTSNNIDLNYSTFIKGSSINASLYYNFSDNSILSYTFIGEDSVSRTSPRNIGENKTIGISLNTNIPFTKNLSFYYNGNANYVDFTSQVNGRTLNNTGITGYMNGNLSYNFKKGWRANSNIGIGLPRVELQGSSNAYYYYSFSLNKRLLKDKLSINASVSNPFQKTRIFRNELQDINFYQKNESYYQMRRFNLSLSYNFGKLQGGIAKKKRGIRNDDVKAGENAGGVNQ